MSQKFYTMKELPESERPYEKLEKNGVKSLSDAELLAILIKNGTKQKNSIDVARDILNAHPVYKGLFGLFHLTTPELLAIDGIGKVKAAQILSAVELSKRLAQEAKPRGRCLNSAEKIAQFFMEEYRTLETEHTVVFYLDGSNRLLFKEVLFMGSVTNCNVSPREILRHGLQYDATHFVVVHNHPSGDPTPSMADIAFTQRLKSGGECVGIQLLDHIIVGDFRYVSLRERGHI